MSMQDPIADMLTRVRNAQAALHKSVSMPSSKLKLEIARVLLEEGFISGVNVTGDVLKTLTIDLKYYNGKGVISSIDRKSKPGLRRYNKCNNLDKVLGGLGVPILTTSKGVMTAANAATHNVGGEVICWVT